MNVTLFGTFRLSVRFAFPLSVFPHAVAFVQIEKWQIWLCSIHHTVLRLMVQRMEANYCVFDQASCAVLHAWPRSLLTHNLGREAFSSASVKRVGLDFLTTEVCNVNLTGLRTRMTMSYPRRSFPSVISDARFFLFFFRSMTNCFVTLGLMTWRKSSLLYILSHTRTAAQMTVFMRVYE